MRTLGLIGGATWRATALYYEGLNRGVEARLGAGRSARLVLHSIDYGALRAAQAQGGWRAFGRALGEVAVGLKKGGAEALMLASNTFHALAEPLTARSGLPVLHAADAVADAAIAAGYREVGLLGTAFTMTQPFYVERLRARGLAVVVPPSEQIAALDALLLGPLAVGQGLDEGRERVLAWVAGWGVDAVVLGCTELSLLDLAAAERPLLDALRLHVGLGVVWQCADEGSEEVCSMGEAGPPR